METIAFGKSWFRARKNLVEPWDAAKAQLAHQRRELHVVLLGKDDTVCTVLEFNADYVGVEFLDHVGRSYRSLQFQELEPGRLFLTMATDRQFEGDSDRVRSGVTRYFKPTGEVVVEAEDFRTGQLTTVEEEGDVTSNWEDYPAFGKFQSIAREQR